MKIGIFDNTFKRPTLEATLDAVADAGLDCAQLHMSTLGMAAMPDAVSDAVCAQIRDAFAARNMDLSCLSGTFNMIHPDGHERAAGLRQLGVLTAAAPKMGAKFISLCTGTRNRDSMWRPHPDNNTPEAWSDLLATVEQAVAHAQAHNVTLVVEPEVANVVDSAIKARRLLDEIQSPHLKIVIDGANIFHKGELAHMHDVLDAAFDLLGDDIVMAHAKDLDHDGEAGKLAAGTGVLDFDHYIGLLRALASTA
ncbi:MAG: sugar phosphate isomerase/epimerase [Caldilineaceae bacterium]